MTDPKIVHGRSLCKSSLSTRSQHLYQLGQLAQRVQIKSTRRGAEPLIGSGGGMVGPLHRHGKAAACRIVEDQRVNAGNALPLEDGKAATP
jgi:hypothetical protein